MNPWSYAADLVDPPTLRWRLDPVAWARERAGIELWSAQQDIIRSVRENESTAVQSCHEVGKSFIAAVTCVWWLDTHPIGEARVVSTAPTGPQVKGILWNEINQLHSKLGMPGRLNLTEWYFGNYMAGLGRKPAEYEPTAFQGLHARFMLVVLDEAFGIPQNLWDAASTLTANEHSRQLVIGNPDGPGPFERVCRDDSGWNVIKIGAKDTPNFTGEQVSQRLKDMLIHPRWVEDRAKAWGRDSALFQSKIEGEFPKQGDPYSVMHYDWISRCRTLEFSAIKPCEIGIDVGAGGDRTVMWERCGLTATRTRTFIDADPVRTAGEINKTIAEWGVEKVKIDSTGIGWAIAGALKDASARHNPTGPCVHNALIYPINFGAGPTSGYEKKYFNKRAEIWWSGRERSRPGVETWDLSNVSDDVVRELTTPRYEIMDSFGKIKIESKKEVIKRLGYSPDNADALLLAFLETEMEGSVSSNWATTSFPNAGLGSIAAMRRGIGR